MSRILAARRDGGRPPMRPAGLCAALALPAAVPVLLAAAVSSVSVPADIPAGGQTAGTVTLDAPVTVATRVGLTSGNTAVATVPASILASGGAASASFAVSAGPAGAGCTTISARTANSPPSSTVAFVQPPVSPEAPLRLQLGLSKVAGGAATRGRVTLAQPAAGNTVVQLSSSSPFAGTPASVAIPAGTASATFPITTQNPGTLTCSVIRAISGNLSARALLKIASGS